MRIEPARVDQIARARTGRMVAIDADVGGVAADLKEIDPHLKVRFAEAADPPCWIVFWESDDQRETYLVTTAQAYQSASGVWTGLDHRMVERVQKIDPRNGYDYAAEVAKQNTKARADRRHAFAEKIGETVELAAHAVRKDTGQKLKGRVFVPKDVA